MSKFDSSLLTQENLTKVLTISTAWETISNVNKGDMIKAGIGALNLKGYGDQLKDSQLIQEDVPRGEVLDAMRDKMRLQPTIEKSRDALFAADGIRNIFDFLQTGKMPDLSALPVSIAKLRKIVDEAMPEKLPSGPGILPLIASLNKPHSR